MTDREKLQKMADEAKIQRDEAGAKEESAKQAQAKIRADAVQLVQDQADHFHKWCEETFGGFQLETGSSLLVTKIPASKQFNLTKSAGYPDFTSIEIETTLGNVPWSVVSFRTDPPSWHVRGASKENRLKVDDLKRSLMEAVANLSAKSLSEFAPNS